MSAALRASFTTVGALRNNVIRTCPTQIGKDTLGIKERILTEKSQGASKGARPISLAAHFPRKKGQWGRNPGRAGPYARCQGAAHSWGYTHPLLFEVAQ